MILLKLKPGAHQAAFTPDAPPHRITGVINWHITNRPHLWHPPTDIYEIEDKFVVRVEVAGMDENDFSIIVDHNLLVINGLRQDIPERRAFHQMEINYGEFSTGFEIPSPVETEKVTADYRDGFLIVILPKSQAKQIKITSSAE